MILKMSGNFPTFEQISAMSDAEVSELSLETLMILADDIKERSERISTDKGILEATKLRMFRTAMEDAYRDAEKDTGTVTVVEHDGIKVKAEKKKVVIWAKDFLEGMWKKITDAGDNPSVYIKRETSTTYSVSENVFKEWPEEYQTAFTPGRTVKPATPVITIERAKEKRK